MEVTAGATLVLIAVAIIIPVCTRSSRFEKVLVCEGQLHTLYQQSAKAPAPGPKQLGCEYWARLARTEPPLVSAEILKCPLQRAPDAGAVQYLGPSDELSTLGEKDPIGCDFELNHSDDAKEGGNVLLKTGEVITDRTGLWGSALYQRKCRP